MSARRKVVRILIVVVAVALGLGWWRYAPQPLVGGGQPDGLLARWVKKRIYRSVSPLDEQGFARLTPQNAAGWYGLFREPIQSVEYYRAQHPVRPTPQRHTLVLQPIGPMSGEQRALLSTLKEYCEAFFQLPVRIEKPLPLSLARAWMRPKRGSHPGASAGEGQYNAGEIVDRVLAPCLPEDAAAYLGITMADLWADDLSYVFGLGSLEKRSGVYSLCRYDPRFWGHAKRPQDAKLMLRRACRVLNHEVGHIFGLQHCVLYKCSMNGGNSLADMDATPLDYCPVCHRKLLWNIGCDGSKRYEDLLNFYRKHGLSSEARWTEGRLERWRRIADSVG
jgi:archaemetzincin